MARYVLLPMGTSDPAQPRTGAAFAVGGRASWYASLAIGALDALGSVTVAIEGNPIGPQTTDSADYIPAAPNPYGYQAIYPDGPLDADSSSALWTPIYTFAAQTAAGTTGPLQIDIPAHLKFFRARITAQTGSCTLLLQADARFTDETDQALLRLLPRELQEYDQGLARLIAEAELDCLELLVPDGITGRFDADLEDPLFPDTFRRAVAAQATWLDERERIAKKDPTAARKLGRYPELGVRERVQRFIGDKERRYWRGR